MFITVVYHEHEPSEVFGDFDSQEAATQWATNHASADAWEVKEIKPTRQHCLNAQKEYCKQTGAPHFAPYDGICYHCRKDIVTGYEEKWSGLITGCPKCYQSYCD